MVAISTQTTQENIVPSETKSYAIKKKIDGFWKYCKDNNYIPDVETLALYLDVHRKTLWAWETGDNKVLSNIIKKAKNTIFHEQKQLAFRGKLNATIFIFNAKNNFGYVDKIEHEHSNNTNVTVSFNIPKLDTTIPTKTIEGVVIESTPIKQLTD
jgi:hypothetical protein